MEPAIRAALVQHFGELTMEAVCSVTRSRELEAENAELRKLVTEERLRVKALEERLQVAEGTALNLAQVRDQLQTDLAQRAPKRPSRRKTPPATK